MEERKFRSLSSKLVCIEERSRLLKNLSKHGIGLREEEEFLRKESLKCKGEKKFDKKNEILKLLMNNKIKDNTRWGTKVRRLRNRTRGIIGTIRLC